MKPTFRSHVLIHPGLNNSAADHWQSLWENEYGFVRVKQDEWDTPDRDAWVKRLDEYINAAPDPASVIIVGHSLACATIVHWAQTYERAIRGALLVAPSDTEAPSYPPGTYGFIPMPLFRLPFPAITITSHNDVYVSPERALHFAEHWGTPLVDIGPAGHINVASGHGPWPQGLFYLKQLDNRP